MKTVAGNIMSNEDVMFYVMYMKKKHKDWKFDEITGGRENFVDDLVYQRLKDWFLAIYR